MAMSNDDTIAIEAKIQEPVTWGDYEKFKIIDLLDTHYDETLKLIERHFFAEDPMCRSIGILEDPPSVNSYMDLIKQCIKDTTSLIAVSLKSGRVVGVIITGMIIEALKNDTYTRMKEFDGEAMETIMDLNRALIIQANVFENLKLNNYLRIYVICVHSSYKVHRVGKALLETCSRLAFFMKVPAIAGIFTSSEHQVIARNVGFSELSVIPYNTWIIDEEIVFDDPGIGNYSASFMYMYTPDEETLLMNEKQRKKEEKLDRP